MKGSLDKKRGSQKRNVDASAVMGSPLRVEIVLALITLDEASVAEVAAHLGRTTKSLYHHVRLLESLGVVEVSGHRMSGARSEALYRTTGSKVTVKAAASRASFVSAALRMAEREHRQAVESGWQEEVAFVRSGVRMSDEDAAELRRRLREIGSWLAGRMDPAGRRVSCTLLCVPVEVDRNE